MDTNIENVSLIFYGNLDCGYLGSNLKFRIYHGGILWTQNIINSSANIIIETNI